MSCIQKSDLQLWYVREGKSMRSIADTLNCSIHKVEYWMRRHHLRRRSISEAVYLKHNPHGDPFRFRPPRSKEDWKLFGIGLGLYWGEGTKASPDSVRLGNADPALIATFLRFLERCFGVHLKDCRFGLQIFSDIPKAQALRFWEKKLQIPLSQFYKVIITPTRGKGTYRHKSSTGVLTLYYNNTKLKRLLMELLAEAARETNGNSRSFSRTVGKPS